MRDSSAKVQRRITASVYCGRIVVCLVLVSAAHSSCCQLAYSANDGARVPRAGSTFRFQRSRYFVGGRLQTSRSRQIFLPLLSSNRNRMCSSRARGQGSATSSNP